MKYLRYIFFFVVFTGSYSFSQNTSQDILHKFTSAFNQQNADEMVVFVSDSIKWFSISDDTLTVEVIGKSALVQWLRGYFKQCPSCRSELLSLQTAGRFISVHEKASWKGKNGDRSQKSLAIYEIINEKIQRVWYYPAEK